MWALGWLWLTLDIAVVLAIAGSTKRMDVSPSVVVAVLSLLTIVLVVGGLFAIQPVFARAYTVALRFMSFLLRHRRAITAWLWRVSVSVLKWTLVLAAVLVGIGAYVQALMWGLDLTIMTADQLGSVPTELGPDVIPVWVETFARMYVATLLFAICIAVIYLPAKRGMPKLRSALG